MTDLGFWDVVIFTVKFAVLYFMLRMAYKSGFKSGGKAVLAQWIKFNEEMKNELEKIRK